MKPARAWPHAGRLPWTTLRAPVGLPTGAEWPVWRGTPPGRLVANDIKPGVCSGQGHTAPGTVTEGRRASSRDTPPARPVRGRPWKRRRCTPTVVTVHTDRRNCANRPSLRHGRPSAMRPWTAQQHGLRRDKVTHAGTEKNAPPAREFAASGPFSQVVAGGGFEPPKAKPTVLQHAPHTRGLCC